MIENKEKRIREIETFFKNKTLPKQIQLNKWTLIDDTEKFIQSLLTVVKNQSNQIYSTYLEQLEELKTFLQNETQ